MSTFLARAGSSFCVLFQLTNSRLHFWFTSSFFLHQIGELDTNLTANSGSKLHANLTLRTNQDSPSTQTTNSHKRSKILPSARGHIDIMDDATRNDPIPDLSMSDGVLSSGLRLKLEPKNGPGLAASNVRTEANKPHAMDYHSTEHNSVREKRHSHIDIAPENPIYVESIEEDGHSDEELGESSDDDDSQITQYTSPTGTKPSHSYQIGKQSSNSQHSNNASNSSSVPLDPEGTKKMEANSAKKVKERQRRGKLSESFKSLRKLVPGCADPKKVNQGQVMSNTVQYIGKIQAQVQSMQSELKQLTTELENLKKQRHGTATPSPSLSSTGNSVSAITNKRSNKNNQQTNAVRQDGWNQTRNSRKGSTSSNAIPSVSVIPPIDQLSTFSTGTKPSDTTSTDLGSTGNTKYGKQTQQSSSSSQYIYRSIPPASPNAVSSTSTIAMPNTTDSSYVNDIEDVGSWPLYHLQLSNANISSAQSGYFADNSQAEPDKSEDSDCCCPDLCDVPPSATTGIPFNSEQHFHHHHHHHHHHIHHVMPHSPYTTGTPPPRVQSSTVTGPNPYYIYPSPTSSPAPPQTSYLSSSPRHSLTNSGCFPIQHTINAIYPAFTGSSPSVVSSYLNGVPSNSVPSSPAFSMTTWEDPSMRSAEMANAPATPNSNFVYGTDLAMSPAHLVE